MNTENFFPKTEKDRRRAISFTQIVLSRVKDVVSDDVYFEPNDSRIKALISEYSLTDCVRVLSYVKRHFNDVDVRAELGADESNKQRIYIHLHCMIKAIGPNNSQRRKPFFR
ncbi:MAG: hypothetical protein AAB542_01020 [Patescibacteria group bacterium]